MPAIVWREETLNGAAEICLLKDRSSYFLRIYREKRKYSFSSLKTGDLELARKKALEVYVETTSSAPKSRTRSYLLETAMDEWLKEKEQDVDNNELSKGSLDTYRQRIFQRILPYAKSKGVKNIGELTRDTFLDYKKHYQGVSEKGRWNEKSDGLSASTINSDLSTLKTILSWMVEKQLLDANFVPSLKKVRDRKDHREESNPAFYPKDWEVIVSSLDDFVENGVEYVDDPRVRTNPSSKSTIMDHGDGKAIKSADDFKRRWRQQHFVNYVRWQYETGCRPHETDLVRFKDVELKTNYDPKQSKEENLKNVKVIIKINPLTKTGRRNVVAWFLTFKRIKLAKANALSFIQSEILEHNRAVEEGTKRGKLKPVPESCLPDGDDLLFFNPFQQSGKRSNYTDIWYNNMWKELLRFCAKRNPEFPQNADKIYTKYSLRSSHITHELLRGTDIRVIADNVGNSQSEIERTYKRPMNELNIDVLGMSKAIIQLDRDENTRREKT